jgi:hypothetical protein
MALLYDFNNITNSADIVSIWNFLQFNVGVPMSEIALLIVFAVAFFSLKGYDTMKAFMAAMVAVDISAIMLWAAHLLNVDYVYGCTVLLGVSLMLMYFWER